MKIQIITNGKSSTSNCIGSVKYSRLNAPHTFDEFDANFIDLQDSNIWNYVGDSPISINCINDLLTLRTLIESCTKPVFIILPPNHSMKYYRGTSGQYFYQVPLKDNIKNVVKIIEQLLPRNCQLSLANIAYEIAETLCGKQCIKSQFYFIDAIKNVVTRAKYSNKPTTIRYSKNCFLTTLELTTNNIWDFLSQIGLQKNTTTLPTWLNNVHFFNDKQLQDEIDKKKQDIEAAEKIISLRNEELLVNLKYKSVLCSSGDELVEVVFDMLQKMLACDLSNFVDEKREDFLIELSEAIFIGEIKGINTNVKNANVSQLDVHYQHYLDEHPEVDSKSCKAILIINSQRTKMPADREPVHDEQIKLAKRNNSLILLTTDLLTIFENFLSLTITRERIIAELLAQIGLFDSSKLY